MKPGRELDALIAEKVMGLERWPGVPGAFRAPIQLPGQTPKPCEPPPFSTSIASAWRVVEKLTALRMVVQVFSYHNGSRAIIYKNDSLTDVASIANACETAPLAICLAALRALGQEVKSE